MTHRLDASIQALVCHDVFLWICHQSEGGRHSRHPPAERESMEPEYSWL